jgi:hypothetical protein
MKLLFQSEGVTIIVEHKNWEGDQLEFFMALKRAITNWVDNTAFGRKCYEDFGNAITLEDLSVYIPDCFLSGNILSKILREEGISYFTITKHTGQELLCDRAHENLYDPSL